MLLLLTRDDLPLWLLAPPAPLPGLRARSALTPQSSGQVHVFGHDGDALSVDGAQVGVFEETHLLKCRARSRL